MEDIKKVIEDTLKEKSGQVTEQIKGLEASFDAKIKANEVANEELKSEVATLKSEKTTLSNQFDAMQVEMKSGKGVGNKFKSASEQYFDSLSPVIEAIKKSGKDAVKNFVGMDVSVKVAAQMTTGSSLMANEIFLTRNDVDSETYKPVKNPNIVLELIPLGTTNASTVYWRERITTEGKPVTVAEAASYPREQIKWEEQSEKVKKIGVFETHSAEMIEDTDYVAIEIPRELSEDMLIELNTQVFTGSGTGTNLNGLKTIATAFARPVGIGQMANVTNVEVLRVAILQARKKNHNVNAIVLNPTDTTLMELEKATDGHYILPPFTSADGMKIKGVRVIEDNNMTEGDFFVGDFTKTKLKIKRRLEYKLFDQDAQDAIDDIYTSTMSLRAVLQTPRPNRTAFIKGTFSTAITALEAAVA